MSGSTNPKVVDLNVAEVDGPEIAHGIGVPFTGGALPRHANPGRNTCRFLLLSLLNNESSTTFPAPSKRLPDTSPSLPSGFVPIAPLGSETNGVQTTRSLAQRPSIGCSETQSHSPLSLHLRCRTQSQVPCLVRQALSHLIVPQISLRTQHQGRQALVLLMNPPLCDAHPIQVTKNHPKSSRAPLQNPPDWACPKTERFPRRFQRMHGDVHIHITPCWGPCHI